MISLLRSFAKIEDLESENDTNEYIYYKKLPFFSINKQYVFSVFSLLINIVFKQHFKETFFM